MHTCITQTIAETLYNLESMIIGARCQTLQTAVLSQPKMLATVFARFIGVIFLLIAAVMLVAPGMNLAGDGIDFASFPIAGKAEVRASARCLCFHRRSHLLRYCFRCHAGARLLRGLR